MKRMWSIKQIKDFIKTTPKDISTLVDAQGHDRFIGGNITIQTIEGFTQTFGKWTLSGTHLMIGIVLEAENGADISSGYLVQGLELPDWIMEKIVSNAGSGAVDNKTFTFFGNDSTSQAVQVVMTKVDNKINLYMGAITFTRARSGRIGFDLIID